MISREQLLNGIISYIDNEIIPQLPTIGKWGIGTLVTLSATRYNEIYNALIVNPLIKSLGIVDDNGSVDFDNVATALKKSADKYGKLIIELPVIGTLAFTADDIDKLSIYVIGGVNTWTKN